jgi:hypothetical protein
MVKCPAGELAGFFMRYGLRTLLIVLAAAPPLLAAVSWAARENLILTLLGIPLAILGGLLCESVLIYLRGLALKKAASKKYGRPKT